MALFSKSASDMVFPTFLVLFLKKEPESLTVEPESKLSEFVLDYPFSMCE